MIVKIVRERQGAEVSNQGGGAMVPPQTVRYLPASSVEFNKVGRWEKGSGRIKEEVGPAGGGVEWFCDPDRPNQPIEVLVLDCYDLDVEKYKRIITYDATVYLMDASGQTIEVIKTTSGITVPREETAK